MLPAPGEILVEPGQKVEALTVIGQTETPSRFRIIDIARQLGWPDVDLDEVLHIAEGESVTINQIIASAPGGVTLLKRSVRTPVAGHVAAIGPTWVLLETERTPTEVQAFISGVVARVLGNRGVVVEANGTIIEAACGFGGEAVGRLKRLVNSPFEPLSASALNEDASDSIILGGQTVDEEVLREAEKWKVRGIIVGSIDASLLELDPPTKVRVVATEGFGEPAVVRAVVDALDAGDLLMIGNSLPVRHLDTWASHRVRDVGVLSQRGASGIDGLIAGGAGAAAASGARTVALLGDVSFLHGAGGLALTRALTAPFVVVVLNNGGGRIFEQLPVAGRAGDAIGHFTTPHETDLQHAARLHGAHFARVASESALRSALGEALGRTACTVLEARVPDDGARGAGARLFAALHDAMAQLAGDGA